MDAPEDDVDSAHLQAAPPPPGGTRPTFEYVADPTTESTNAIPPAGAAASSFVAPPLDTSTPAPLPDERVAGLRPEAMERAKVTQSPGRLSEWLVKQGLSKADADRLAHDVWSETQHEEQTRREQASSQRRADNTVAIIEMMGGVVLLFFGLIVGYFVLVSFALIFDGFRRYDKG